MSTHQLLPAKFIASLSFRGFATTPAEVQSLVGTPASMLVSRGQARKPGTTPFQRSVASWKIDFPESTRLDEMIPALIERLGGAKNLLAAKNVVSPEFLEIDITMRIVDSEEQEGGFIDTETLAMLVNLGATLSFGFYSRSDA